MRPSPPASLVRMRGSKPAPLENMRPPPSASLVRSLAEAKARIFQTMPPKPEGQSPSLRTGAKFLRKRLVGPSMLRYYPTSLRLGEMNKIFFGAGGPFADQTWTLPDGSERTGFIEEKEHIRLMDVEKRKANGKGPPKKGQGRRSQMKSKKR